MILPKIRDPRFTALRRGGTLTNDDHHALAVWAAQCAGHVLHLFEDEQPGDGRPRRALELTHAWVRGEITMQDARVAAFHANAAASERKGAARFAAYSAGQAVVVAHVAAHYLGAAAYAIKAVWVASGKLGAQERGKAEWQWQIDLLPLRLKDLVLEDQRNRNSLCWNAFDV